MEIPRDILNVGHKTQNKCKQSKQHETENLNDEQRGPHQNTEVNCPHHNPGVNWCVREW
jgi:hypothetical protein